MAFAAVVGVAAVGAHDLDVEDRLPGSSGQADDGRRGRQLAVLQDERSCCPDNPFGDAACRPRQVDALDPRQIATQREQEGRRRCRLPPAHSACCAS